MTFTAVLARWELAQRACVEARAEYERTYAEAIIKADGKTDTIRKAQADLGALEAYRLYELSQIDAKSCEHMVDWMKRHQEMAA